MAETKITKPPSPKPTNLMIRRSSDNDNAAMEALWGVPADALSDTNHRWQSLDEYWTFEASNNMSSNWVPQRGDGHAMADKIWVRDKGADHSSDIVWYNRLRYHPCTMNRYLNSVTCKLVAGNSKGSKSISKKVWPQVPTAPVINEPEYDNNNQAVTFAIDFPEITGMRECYDVKHCIARKDALSLNSAYSGKWTETAWSTFRTDSYDSTYNLALNRAIQVGEWVVVECRAYSRGLKGDSGVVTKRYVYAYPAYAYIKSVKSSDKTDLASVYISVHIAYATSYDKAKKKDVRTNLDPVDTIKLQRLYNTNLATQAAADGSGSWQDVDGAVDDGNCIGFYDSATDAMPEVGKHTWYRVVTQHGPFTRVSHAYEAQCLFSKSDEVANDEAKIKSLEPGADGESIVGVVGWRNDDSTTTEISWSDHQGAWWSNTQPESMDITWKDSTSQVYGFPNSATFYIRGLEKGKNYFVRARRKQVDGDSVSYGPWQFLKESYPVSLVEAPTDVHIAAPVAIERGSGIPCTWTFNGPEQTEWNLYRVSRDSAILLGGGEGPDASFTIPASKLVGLNSAMLYVSITCGGKWTESNRVTVVIDEAPSIGLTVNDILTAQPLAINLTTNSSVASATVLVASHLGITGESPDGDFIQEDGDVIWSADLDPGELGWTGSGNLYSATVTLPTGLDFKDNGSYVVTATTRSQYGLASEPASETFRVEWAHQALPPSSAEIVIDEQELSATITPYAPEEAANSDVCDVYRLTPDGAYLIARDVEFGTSIVDPFCPYSNLPDAELAYRLCTRTVDGDIQWADFPYSLKRSFVRLDWDGGFIELPYDIIATSGWEKGFELDERLDGSRVGNWDSGATKEVSIALDLVKTGMWSEAATIREIGKASHAYFVRSQDGCAYAANVQVDSMDFEYSKVSVPVSMKVTEINFGEEFWAVPEGTLGGD